MFSYDRPEWWYENDSYDIWQDEIDNLKTEIARKLSQVVKGNNTEHFAKILAFAFFEQEESALKMCGELGIYDRHFYAMEGNINKLQECFVGEW